MPNLPIHSVRVSIEIPGDGRYECSATTLDQMIRRYLPASVLDMRRHLDERSPDVDHSGVDSVSTALVMLGDLSAHEFLDHGA